MGRSSSYSSPSSKIRSLRRLLAFAKKISGLKPKLTKCSQVQIYILPECLSLAYSKPTLININPTNATANYHPYVVEAIKLMYSKAPDELSADEWDQFQAYYQWKKEKGEPIENDIVYKPRSSS